jgi:hypothetical protein
MTEQIFESFEISVKKRRCLILALKESWLPLIGVPIFGIPSGALLWYGIAISDYRIIIGGSVFIIGAILSMYAFTGLFRSNCKDLLIKELGVHGTGKILSIEEERDTSTEETIGACNQRTKTTRTDTFYTVAFEYEFEGKKYTSVQFLENESLVELLAVGDEVPITILSSKPEEALIKERGLQRKLGKRSG